MVSVGRYYIKSIYLPTPCLKQGTHLLTTMLILLITLPKMLITLPKMLITLPKMLITFYKNFKLSERARAGYRLFKKSYYYYTTAPLHRGLVPRDNLLSQGGK